jgi:hypothetical protein
MHVHLINEPDTRSVLYPLFIANGITGIRVMNTLQDINIAQQRVLQSEIRSGKLIGPKSLLGSFQVNGTWNGPSTVLKPKTEKHGRELALLLKERGVDFIKIYDGLTPEAYHGIADEANKLNLDFAGHVPLTIKPSQASDAGQKSIEHTEIPLFLECSAIENEMRERVINLFTNQDGNLSFSGVKNVNELMFEMVQTFDSLKCQNLYEKLKINNTWFVPTLSHLEIYYPDREDWKDHPNTKYMPKEEYYFFKDEFEPSMRAFRSPYIPEVEEMRRKIVADMQRAGVGLLAGTDMGEVGLIGGFSLHEELVSLQSAGLTPLEALQTATLNPARYQHGTDSLGTVEQGKIADLLLLNKNPLEDIRNTQEIDAVFTNGQYLTRKDLDSLLLDVENYIKNEN